jgi:hypothetical protein
VDDQVDAGAEHRDGGQGEQRAAESTADDGVVLGNQIGVFGGRRRRRPGVA